VTSLNWGMDFNEVPYLWVYWKFSAHCSFTSSWFIWNLCSYLQFNSHPRRCESLLNINWHKTCCRQNLWSTHYKFSTVFHKSRSFWCNKTRGVLCCVISVALKLLDWYWWNLNWLLCSSVAHFLCYYKNI